MCGSPRINGWLLVGMAKRSRSTAVQGGRSAGTRNVSPPSRRCPCPGDREAIPRRAPLSLQPRAHGLSVQNARAHVMCGHRLTKLCWQRLAGHCVVLLMLRQCRQLGGRSVRIQIPQRLEALGLQPTSGACSRAAFSSRSWPLACRPASVSVS